MKTVHAIIIGMSIILGLGLLGLAQSRDTRPFEAAAPEAGRFQITCGVEPHTTPGTVFCLWDTKTGRTWHSQDCGEWHEGKGGPAGK